MKLVDISDSKSEHLGGAGSTPARGTILKEFHWQYRGGKAGLPNPHTLIIESF